MPSDPSMQHLSTAAELDAALGPGEALLLKHGGTCPISASARVAVQEFQRTHPEVPVYAVEVTRHRALSDAIAERMGVAHESPQLFLLRDGRPVWHATHFAITPAAIAERRSTERG